MNCRLPERKSNLKYAKRMDNEAFLFAMVNKNHSVPILFLILPIVHSV